MAVPMGRGYDSVLFGSLDPGPIGLHNNSNSPWWGLAPHLIICIPFCWGSALFLGPLKGGPCVLHNNWAPLWGALASWDPLWGSWPGSYGPYSWKSALVELQQAG